MPGYLSRIEKKMQKSCAIFATFVIIIIQNDVMGDLAYFKPITNECNNTFPLSEGK